MTKKQLVAKIAADTNISKAAADKAVNSLTDNVSKALKKGDKVTFVGFGTFSVKKRAARTGRNPQTGETIKIKAAKVPKFSPGKSLKEMVK
ncbi:MAG: DNA-binding protein HU [Candidatus Schekmanbacteria bacterium RBG_13_48_7]|uniref:DNA-binding protein HU n=1 Tax=Candidatus Schekmanbacteria bacterium RBG_13_48_7 TaxID=1817878 RepID=A0A1F7RPD2_9BACT|nr:MAG: DNA-binding protein HU [Candidatus Schekmanbacteria bacterium RBG_13_48_7]